MFRMGSSSSRTVAWVPVFAGIFLVYIGSLVAYHLLVQSTRELPAPHLGFSSDTVVLVNLESLDTIDNQLSVKVLVIPDDSLMDTRLDVLNTDIAVGVYPANELGDLFYPAGRKPSLIRTVVAAKGNSHNWPFDSYSTPELAAWLLTGTGADRQPMTARVEVTGSIEGWEISTSRGGDATQTESDRGDDVTITLRRARGPLVFDLGICLILMSLPAIGLFVVTAILRGRKKLQPGFIGWYAAMLFAVVPIRTILPGSPPYGSWVDQGIVLWVLIALVVEMAVFVLVWYRSPD